MSINRILESITRFRDELDSGLINGRRALTRFISRLPDIALTSKDFDVTQAFALLSLTPTLIDTYFERKLQIAILREIESTKYEKVSSTIKLLIKREIYVIDADKHFDGDYLPLIEKVKEDFTGLKEVGKLGEDYSKQYMDTFLDLILTNSEMVVKEINMIVSSFFNKALETLNKNPSTEAFKNEVEKFVRELHRKVYGWPEGES